MLKNKERAIDAIFLDLDGTVLNENGEISAELISCISKLKSLNVLIFLVSGRSYESILPHYNTLNLNTPIIAYNGSQLLSSKGEMLKENILNSLLVRDALKIAIKSEVYIQFYIDKQACYIGDENLAMEYCRKSGIMPIKLKQLEHIENRCTNGMFLVSEYNCNNSPLLSIIRDLEKSSLWSEYGSFYLSSCGTLEFSNKGISKGAMVTHLIDDLQIDPKRTLAIGDGLNDKEMLEIAAYSAAMGNASDELKKIADLTIESNSNNGVANFLESIF